jgi:hypothetical protein
MPGTAVLIYDHASVKPNIIAVIPLVSTSAPGFNIRAEIPALLQRAGAKLDKPEYLLAEFNEATNQWEAVTSTEQSTQLPRFLSILNLKK